MDNPASLKDMERFGLQPKPGHLYAVRNCQCATEYIVELSGSRTEPKKVKGECAFCHGPLSFKTDYADVDFHFEKEL